MLASNPASRNRADNEYRPQINPSFCRPVCGLWKHNGAARTDRLCSSKQVKDGLTPSSNQDANHTYQCGESRLKRLEAILNTDDNRRSCSQSLGKVRYGRSPYPLSRTTSKYFARLSSKRGDQHGPSGKSNDPSDSLLQVPAQPYDHIGVMIIQLMTWKMEQIECRPSERGVFSSGKADGDVMRGYEVSMMEKNALADEGPQLVQRQPHPNL